ncbi:MAG: DUF3883 domain-containing protein [Cyanobacteriota bacterium]
MPKGVSAESGPGYYIESLDADGNLFFIELKGRVDGADSVTLTINEVNTGRNAPHRFRLALVSVEGDRAWPPVYGSGVDWGLPGFGDPRSPRTSLAMATSPPTAGPWPIASVNRQRVAGPRPTAIRSTSSGCWPIPGVPGAT